jgi:NAD(P)-dependent dehydrogenase (short-subunit alcohol dehydrogenase family)
MRFKDTTALVTGASSGIGAAIAMQLASEGASVHLLSEKPLADTEIVSHRIRSAGGLAASHQCDVSSEATVQEVITQIVQRAGRVDVLVNCAGVFSYGPMEDTSLATLERTLRVNFIGTYLMTRAVLPIMKRQGRGAIVNIASAAAHFATAGLSAYAASKGAIVSMTRAMVPELARTGVRINVILPGAVRTPMIAMAHTPTTPGGVALLQYLEQTTLSPYGDTYMPPEDVAEVAVFLASGAARGIQGAAIDVTHGMGAAQASPPVPQ